MIDKEIIKYKNVVTIISIGMLLIAIPTGLWGYGYYVLLRWVVTGTALFVLWAAYELKETKWIWIMGLIALLFNPIAPIYLDKNTWVIIDFIVAGIFLISIFKTKK